MSRARSSRTPGWSPSPPARTSRSPPSPHPPASTSAAAPVPAPARASRPVRPMVVADLPAPALDAEGLRECAQELAGSVDAALIGEPPGARVQFPPSYRARLLTD